MRFAPTHRPRRTPKPTGFTLVELLVVVAILALLMSIAVPALNSARRTAKRTAMAAELRSIDTALENFKLDFNRYPQSAQAEKIDPNTKMPNGGKLIATSQSDTNDFGAQLLAQALFGWDLLGPLDRKSQAGKMGSQSWYTLDSNGKPNVRRQNLYLGPDTVTLKKATEVFDAGTYGNSPPTPNENLVIVDNFNVIKPRPILYYKANRNRTKVGENQGVNKDQGIYNMLDNDVFTSTGGHFDQDPSVNPQIQEFEKAIYNPKTVPPNYTGSTPWDDNSARQVRPYNRDRFILWSAGPDGIYGSDDDVYNFEKQ